MECKSTTSDLCSYPGISSPITYVTQPFLPPLSELIPYLEDIWDRKVLTNIGKYHHQLEENLCEYLGVKHISLFANGTLALVAALQSLEIRGEVITTPFSFIATSHSLLWNGVKPIFVDIDPDTLNIDPNKIEAAITPDTTAILAVHCYGHPCDVETIQSIADKHNLKVVYDGAHAFGVECDCGSILNHGDLTIVSFHATKVFNTFEGGAVISRDPAVKLRIDQLKNFGHNGETEVNSLGINGKMSEFNAALGLLQLKYIKKAIGMRMEIDREYRINLSKVKGIHCLNNSGERVPNFSYLPILVNSDYPISRDELYEKLKLNKIHPRRYFYPLISSFAMYRHFASSDPSNLPVATQAASQILCLPIYPDLPIETVHQICQLISEQ